MATPLLQKARQRKLAYFIAIVVLFTVSLIHREFLVKPQAFALQLRETARGDVELTSSAIRLMLTGSRGIAVTMLWYTAMDRQKRNEWHELELLVSSITKLQPYFITPWLYQSWNISFNVAVECDRPRDKYYYISRGLELLAEGERRNRGIGDEDTPEDSPEIVFPGHPELRYFMGFYYQLKIGTSDERLTMRCLLELSCIDPLERDPKNFEKIDESSGHTVIKTQEFRAFCQNYPRLVRRLCEQLSRDRPEDIVQFLKDHQEIPNRFKASDQTKTAQARKSLLKPELEQFPIVPPPRGKNWPDPSKDDLGLIDESIDVFLLCRAWYTFAQKPLPPTDRIARPTAKRNYNKQRYRIPRHMVTQLFRQYPARAQVYIAETLDSEGWFDNSGWSVQQGFQSLPTRGADDEGDLVGTKEKYHSRRAWESAYDMYKEYGIENGIYLDADEMAALDAKAQFFRKHPSHKAPLTLDELPTEKNEWREGALGVSYDAHCMHYYSRFYRRLANFDAFFYQAEAERDPILVAARKAIHVAERKRKQGTQNASTLALYEQAWPLWVHAWLKYPKFARVGSVQDDFSELYQRYLGLQQQVYMTQFRQAALAAVRFAPPAIPDGLGILCQQLHAQRRLYSLQEKDEHLHRELVKTSDVLPPAIADWIQLHSPSVLGLQKRSEAVQKDEADFQRMVLRIVPLKKRVGPLDHVQYYYGPASEGLREHLFEWTTAWTFAGGLGAGGLGNVAISSWKSAHYLTRRVSDTSLVIDEPDYPWPALISPDARRIAANRLGLDR